MPFTVGDLILAPKPAVTLRKSDSVVHAVGLMRDRDFSQMPVVDDQNKPVGIVTSDSICWALDYLDANLKGLPVSHVMRQQIHTFRLDDLLSSLQSALMDSYAAFIVDDGKRLVGIVTNYDTAEYYRRRAQDMMQVEEIEVALRDHVRAAFNYREEAIAEAARKVSAKDRDLPPERVQVVLRKYLEFVSQGAEINQRALKAALATDEKPKTPAPVGLASLTLHQLIGVLFDGGAWNEYRAVFGSIDKAQWRRSLTRVREIRNDLAHFKRELTKEDRRILTWTADFLANHPPPQRDVGFENAVNTTASDTARPPVASREGDAEPAPVDPDAASDGGKYARLVAHLRQRPISQSSVTLSFGEIETLLQSSLPDSARELRAWWANDEVGHSHARQWLDADWRVATVNLSEQRVTFARMVERERAYIAFYARLEDELKARKFRTLGLSPSGVNWHNVAALEGQSARFGFAFARGRRFTAYLYLDLGSKERTKWVFDALHDERAAIEAAFGQDAEFEITWQRMEDTRASRISVYGEGAIEDVESRQEALRMWAADVMVRLHGALAERAGFAIAKSAISDLRA